MKYGVSAMNTNYGTYSRFLEFENVPGIFLRFLPIALAVACLCGSSLPVAAQAAAPVSDFGDLEGEWSGTVPGAYGRPANIIFTATSEGGRIDINGMMTRCQIVIDPDTGDSYLYGNSRPECKAGTFTASRSGKTLEVMLSDWESPATLSRLSGRIDARWLDNVPEAAVVRGVRLGAPAPDNAQQVEGARKLRNFGMLPDQFARGSFLGMAGRAFLPARYQLASVPEDIPQVAEDISFDNTGIYSIDDRVVAVLRQYEPPQDQSPRYEAVQEALKLQMGPATVETPSGVGMYYEWLFDEEGVLYSGRDGARCETRFGGSEENARMIGMEFAKTDTSLAEISQGLAPRVVPKSEYFELRVTAGCGYTVRYHIHPTRNGLLEEMSVVAFAHDPVRAAIWSERQRDLSSEIAEELDLQRASQTIKPKL